MQDRNRRTAIAFLILLLSVSLFSSVLALEIPLSAVEADNYIRRAEPVRTGVLLPKGAVTDISSLSLKAADGKPVPVQVETLTTRPDGSPRWVLIDFFADCPAGGKAFYTLTDQKQSQSQ